MRIDKLVALPLFDLLGAIIAALPTYLGRFNTLTVGDPGAGLIGSSLCKALVLAQSRVELLPASTPAPDPPIGIGLGPWWQVMGDRSLLTPRTNHVEDRIDHDPQWIWATSASSGRQRQQRFKYAPFAIGQITGI